MLKKFSIIMCVVFLMLTACAGLQLNKDEATKITVNILSRRLAYQILKNNPNHMDTIIFYATALQEEDITQAVIDTGINYLSENFGDDPLLVSDLRDLAKLIVLDTSDPKFDPNLVRIVAQGFIDAAEIIRAN